MVTIKECLKSYLGCLQLVKVASSAVAIFTKTEYMPQSPEFRIELECDTTNSSVHRFWCFAASSHPGASRISGETPDKIFNLVVNFRSGGSEFPTFLF